MKPARTKDQQAAQAVAYNNGYENGRRDKLLGQRSEYAWAGVDVDPRDSYTYAYSAGYRAGWEGR